MSKKQSKTSKPVSKKSKYAAPVVAAHSEPEAVVTTAAPAAETTAAAVTVPAAAEKPAKVAKQPKAPAAPRVEQNGVRRPKAGGACARVWDHLDANGDMSVADIKAWALGEGLNPGNAGIEIYLWRKFNGIKPVKVAKAPKQAKEMHQAA